MRLLVCLLAVFALALGENERRQIECEENWVGSDCSIYSQAALPNVNYSSNVDTNLWKFYYINLPDVVSVTATVIQALPDPECDLDMYVQKDTFPSFDNFIYRDISVATESALVVPEIMGTYFFGVFGYYGCDYTFSYTIAPSCDCNGNGECVGNQCVCESGWTDETCSTSYTPSQSGQQNAKVSAFGWFNYAIDVEELPLRVEFSLMLGGEDLDTHEADLYVAANRVPTLWDYDHRTPGGGEETNFQLVITEPRANTRYFFSVNTREPSTFYLTATIILRGEGDCNNQCSLHGTCIAGECNCNPGFSGHSCETMDSPLALNVPVSGFVGESSWNYFSTTFSVENAFILVSQTSATADCDLYVKRGLPANFFNYDYANFTTNVLDFTVTIPNPGADTWYLGLYGYTDCEYTIQTMEAVECNCVYGSCGVGSTACVCQPGWGGDDCSVPIYPLQNGVLHSGTSMLPRTWVYFTLPVSKTIGLTVAVKETVSTGFVWLYANVGSKSPTLSEYDFSAREINDSMHQIDILRPLSDTEITIGVYANHYATYAVPYEIVAWSAPF